MDLRWVVVLLLQTILCNMGTASEPVGGVRLGMDIVEAQRVVEAAMPGARVERKTVQIDALGNSFVITYYRRYDVPVKGRSVAMAVSASPTSNQVWMVSKQENFPPGQRLKPSALFEALARFGGVNPVRLRGNADWAEYQQEWAIDGRGKEIGAPQKCAKKWQTVMGAPEVNVAAVELNPNCAIGYGTNFHTTDDLVDIYRVWATDARAFDHWRSEIDQARKLKLNQEAGNSVRPTI